MTPGVGPWQGYWCHYWPGGNRYSTESNNRNSITNRFHKAGTLLLPVAFSWFHRFLPADSTGSPQVTINWENSGRKKPNQNIFSLWLHDTDRSSPQKCSDKTASCLLLCYKCHNMKRCCNKGAWVSGWISLDKIEITAIKSSGKDCVAVQWASSVKMVNICLPFHRWCTSKHSTWPFDLALFHFVIYRTFMILCK